jgi:hypothetical protein
MFLSGTNGLLQKSRNERTARVLFHAVKTLLRAEAQMRNVSLIGTAALLLMLGAVVPTHAQDKPKEEEAKPQESKPAEKPQEAKPAEAEKKPEAPKTAAHTTHTAAKPAPKPQPAPAKKETTSTEAHKTNTEAHKPAPTTTHTATTHTSTTHAATTHTSTSHASTPAHVDTRAQQDEHKQDAARNDQAQHHEGRIPDDKYREHFGHEHTFHISRPVVVEGRSRFDYGGYAFTYGEPWPGAWGYGDPLYIVDINGVYYLMDDSHPGVQLALTIVL